MKTLTYIHAQEARVSINKKVNLTVTTLHFKAGENHVNHLRGFQ